MYTAIWRVLPGPVWLRILLVVLLVAAILTACVLWIFPWVNTLIPMQDVTVDGQ